MAAKTENLKSGKKRKVAESLEGPISSKKPKKLVPTSTSVQPHLDEEISENPPRKKRKAAIEEIEVDITKPEPPSKKALRRLKKGKPLPPSKSGADTSPEPDSEKPPKPEVEKRSKYGVWIGNLPWSATKANLQAFLTSNSDITDENVTRIHMPSVHDGKPANKEEESRTKKKQRNMGFAYVDFAVPEAVEQAIALSEQLLSGRCVLIKDAKSYEGRPQKTKEESKNVGKPPNKRIFVGNLRFDTTEESLKEHFERCGAVENVMIATFEDSGKCKGYGWVTFQDLKAAEAAVRGYILVEEKAEEEEEEEAEEEEEEEKEEEEAEEEEEEEEDSGEDSNSTNEQDQAPSPDSHARAGSKPKAPPKPLRKRFYIDKIHKRPVRREFAEDAQVRYKKRYGKDGTKGLNSVNAGADTAKEGNVDGAGGGGHEVAARARKAGFDKVRSSGKQVEYRKPYAARLTGGIVESKGKKIVF